MQFTCDGLQDEECKIVFRNPGIFSPDLVSGGLSLSEVESRMKRNAMRLGDVRQRDGAESDRMYPAWDGTSSHAIGR